MTDVHAIVVDGLSKKYAKSADFSLAKVSFTVPKGERIAILGPNGAGKSTLISILTGVLDSTEGEVLYLDNQDQSINKELVKKSIGYAPQEYALFDALTPSQHINYFGALYGLDPDQIEQRKTELLEKFELSDQKNKKVRTFSGGMKRRMNLIMSLLHDPQIIFLDEPTAGVDIFQKKIILDYLNEITDQGKTIFYTSHQMEEATNLCNRVILLSNGDVVMDKNMSELDLSHKDLNEVFINRIEAHKNG